MAHGEHTVSASVIISGVEPGQVILGPVWKATVL